MGLQKNTAGQTALVFAFDRTSGEPKTGDAAQITATIKKDFAAGAAIADTNPTEISAGYYEFDLTAGETDADCLDVIPVSSTSDIVVVACPGRMFTTPPGFTDLKTVADAIKTVTDQLPAGGALSTIGSAITTVDTVVDSILDDTGTAGVVLSAGTRQAIADEVLGRGVSNSESTADNYSICSLVLAAFESSVDGSTWTINRTDGTTSHLVRTVTSSASADPITGVT